MLRFYCLYYLRVTPSLFVYSFELATYTQQVNYQYLTNDIKILLRNIKNHFKRSIP